MDNIDHVQKAKDLFKEGYNCAQAVFLAFSDLYDIDFDTAARIMSPFGGGMGRMREVCGAVSGMFTALGFLYGYDDPKNITVKKELYSQVQELAAGFKEENYSIVCREIFQEGAIDTDPMNTKRDADFYKKRPCAEYVASAAELMQEFINKHPL